MIDYWGIDLRSCGNFQWSLKKVSKLMKYALRNSPHLPLKNHQKAFTWKITLSITLIDRIIRNLAGSEMNFEKSNWKMLFNWIYRQGKIWYGKWWKCGSQHSNYSMVIVQFFWGLFWVRKFRETLLFLIIHEDL